MAGAGSQHRRAWCKVWYLCSLLFISYICVAVVVLWYYKPHTLYAQYKNSLSNKQANHRKSARGHRRSPQTHEIYNIAHPPVEALELKDGAPYAGNVSYPVYEPLLDILTRWPPDQPDLLTKPLSNATNIDNNYDFKETLQHFNYSCPRERSLVEAYRDAELPFKLYGIPDIERARMRWSDDYLIDHMGNISPHVEESVNNHFMYWKPTRQSFRMVETSPTSVIDMQFRDWLDLAYEADERRISSSETHYYYMIGVAKQGSSFVNRDLSIFDTKQPNFFITNIKANKGVQCRFSMRGIIAEAHYDTGRNMVAMLKGAKRYILTPPSTCERLGIITDPSHSSYRHSDIDWSNLDEAKEKGFGTVPAIDTIVHEGEVLYIPSYWFHYIVSTKYSIQCNSRSGPPPLEQGEMEIKKCGLLTSNKKGKKLAGASPLLSGRFDIANHEAACDINVYCDAGWEIDEIQNDGNTNPRSEICIIPSVFDHAVRIILI